MAQGVAWGGLCAAAQEPFTGHGYPLFSSS